MPYDANKNELEILKYWQDNQIFEKSVQERSAFESRASGRGENKPYVFYDGPPFATGLPHYGHILGSVIKDVIPRYQTMKGHRVRRRWGWDCHGLPIENLVEKELEVSGKKQIEEKFGVEKFNETCRSKVLMYTKEWKKMVDRIGRWIEFDNAYKTMDPTYMESVWWALKTIWDKGLIYEGRKVLMYCPHCETPVSKAEVAMDDSYKDITEEAVVVKFRLRSMDNRPQSIFGGRSPKSVVSSPIYILAWTTTPWTLPGNVALAVGADIEYWILDIDGESLILAKDRIETVIGDKRYEIRDKMKGSSLVGLEYEPLFEIPAIRETGKKAWYITAADFVTTEEGTGVVHTAVVYGEDDYNLGLKVGLPVVPLLNDAGHFNEFAPEFIRGQYFKKSEKLIKDDLENRGLLFARENHTHSYPHCWRCDTQLFYNAISAWFIDIQKIKKRLIKLNEKINWYPEHLKHGRFLNILETAPDWNISRNRYWATPLPFWRCQNGNTKPETLNSKLCDNVVCVGSVKELREKAINFEEVYDGKKVEEMDLHKHLMDKIKLKCDKCGGEMSRTPEVIDCWVESASMPFAEWHYPFENKAMFEKRFPGQYIGEYIAQTRAWFYYMHVMATLLFDDISFENVVCTGTILNDKGEKLSKSKRNYTDPWVIIEQYGVDALRYYLMTSVVMQADDLYFNDREVRDVYNKVINMLWNVVEFYRMYAGESLKVYKVIKSVKSENVLDKWIMARLGQLVGEVTENLDKYDTVRAGRPIKDFIDDLSTWYLRRSRDRFKGNNEEDKQAALATLHDVLYILSKVMAPFMPFLAEKVYQDVGHRTDDVGRETDSVHLENWPTPAEITRDDVELLQDMEKARKIVEMGLALRAEAGIRVRQPLSELRIMNYELSDELARIIAEELNVKSVEIDGDMIIDGDKVIVKEDGGLKVVLHIEITDELKREGLAREIIRAINQTRKERKLTIKNRVVVAYETDDEMLRRVFTEFVEEIKKAVLADELVEEKNNGTEADLDGHKVKLWIKQQKD
ncbi:MAG: isoleucine--tRNA ligase [Candidatus Magasanikbacteria bacterium]|nr:isoleucine--tRNA ligase [Candidatus Magasanikbacteria bacterium]